MTVQTHPYSDVTNAFALKIDGTGGQVNRDYYWVALGKQGQGGRNGVGQATYTDVSFPVTFKGKYNVHVTDTMGGVGNTSTSLDGALMCAYGDSTQDKFRICVSSSAVGVFDWIAFGC